MKRSQIANRKSQIKKVVIVGGGPAGSSLAIRLAQRGFETVLIEKEKFPRDKLCGEYISPECFRHFDELGALDPIQSAGGKRIYETRFFEKGGRQVTVPSAWFGESGSYALSLSRAEMDFRLLERAKEVGVDVREGMTVVDLEFDGDQIASIAGRSDEGRTVRLAADIFVDATGRAATLGRLSDRKDSAKATASGRPTIVGFKSHIIGAQLEKGVCEIYSFPGGYAGLSHVEGDRANLCFLIKSNVVRHLGNDAAKIVDAVVVQNRRAAKTLQTFSAADWLAVSIKGFGTKRVAAASNLFSVGDAAAFIDPFTGSGIVMALESAEVLARVIVECCTSSASIATEYTERYRQRFTTRLRVCSVLRRAAFMPGLATAAVAGLNISSSSRRLLARATRG